MIQTQDAVVNDLYITLLLENQLSVTYTFKTKYAVALVIIYQICTVTTVQTCIIETIFHVAGTIDTFKTSKTHTVTARPGMNE